MTNENNKPIHKINLGSGITASIWENSTDNGVLHAVEVERRYLQGDEWKTSKTYVGSQILLVSKAYELAFDYIQSIKSKN
ncbi:hypothetical protein [Cerasicoccus maritimus]|uniref:hypothetical protein n=1 Tax=Cerasicoccus maritimus TaxID=490089 RepID=UPI0028528284|nr:hypothetical protein [Cerasicoccus maritimus]